MSQIQRGAPIDDVVVIGSGAGGGTVTRVLVAKGIRVTLLEAGPMLNPARDYKEHLWPYQVAHRGAYDVDGIYFGRQDAGHPPWGYFNALNGYWWIEGEPYTTAPGSEFRWFRSRILGGRTNHYGRITLRFSDYDFKPYSTDGLGTDWPITHEDVAPYYDKMEAFIGVTGTKEGLRTAPDGIFLPPPKPRVSDILVRRACGKLGIPCIAGRRSVLTKPLNGRPACHYCGQCGRGCVTGSNYSSSQVEILPAMKTGRVKVIAGAMARELIVDGSGKVTAVSYVDVNTREERRVKCRVVVAACSACETARLLLNSKSGRHPNGLANSSGVVGKYLTDSVGLSLSARIPALEGMPVHDTDGYGGMHVYIPWWLFEDKKKDFPRGYHVEVGGGFNMPQVGSFHGACRQHEGYGPDLKRKIKEGWGVSVGLAGRGEMIPNEHSYCEIDPDVVDRFGIPVLRFHWRWSEHEIRQARHMGETFRAILGTMGAKVDAQAVENARISTGGTIIHELGTVRMGSDPKTSALNGYSQAWDVKNLFVADAAPFVSNPDKNPTLTINALAWRTSDYIAEEMRRGNV